MACTASIFLLCNKIYGYGLSDHHHHFPLTLKAEASGPLTNVVQNMPKGRARGVDAISSGMSHHVTIVAYSFSSNLGT